MRLVVFGLLFLVFFGCVTPDEADIERNVTDITKNITEEYEIPEENVTEEINETEEVNETVNETYVNETINESEEEEISGILFGEGRYVLIIEDVVWYGDKSCAAINIAYADGDSLKKDVVCPRVDYYWTSPDGHRYRIFISEVAAGYTGEAWAKVFIYG